VNASSKTIRVFKQMALLSLWLVIQPFEVVAQDLKSRVLAASESRLANRKASKSIRSEMDIVFHEIQGQKIKADLYRPDTQENLPIVIMIHGGAWVSGDKWNVSDHASQMADAGFVVMAINYRLAPKNPWPAQLIDCQAAVQWMSDHHEQWHGNIESVGLWGYSAGAQLALMIALETKTGMPRIQACVAGGPPCDLEFVPPKSQLLSSFLGGSREEYPDRYREASPIHLLSSDDPPLFIFHGDQDLIVPIENSQRLQQKAVELGVVIEYREVPMLGHIMTFLDQNSRLEAIRFLKQHLTRSSP